MKKKELKKQLIEMQEKLDSMTVGDLCIDWIIKKVMKLPEEKTEVRYLDKPWEEKRKILWQFMLTSKAANTAVMTMKKVLASWLGGAKGFYVERIVTDTLLVGGYVALEIIGEGNFGDEGLVNIDPATLVAKYDENGKYWIQFPGTEHERKITPDKLIYIVGGPTDNIMSVVEGIYLDLLDLENPYVLDAVSRKISDNIIEAIEAIEGR